MSEIDARTKAIGIISGGRVQEEGRKMSERLTKRDENGNAYYDWGCLNRNHWALGSYVDRLAAYEDTGLSPEEIQELAKAKADGRLVVLPCKVGDTVYVAVKEWDARYCLKSSFVPCVREGTVAHICISHKGIIVCVTVKGEYSEYYEFGKTVFLTREEAEKALEVRE